ncbi:acyl carrier protein [Scytonema sp. PRP1]|uniref:acyl carrier protein n=1 Tax=Scytonema sp. PRP1 TaxID=3120513 RepID=UPI002FD2EE46
MELHQNTSATLANDSKIYSLEEIQNWLRTYVATQLQVGSKKVDITVPFDRYGLDSSTTVGMLADLEDWLGCQLAPTLVYDYPTIQSLAKHLFSVLATAK